MALPTSESEIATGSPLPTIGQAPALGSPGHQPCPPEANISLKTTAALHLPCQNPSHPPANQHQLLDPQGPAASSLGIWLCPPVGQHQPPIPIQALAQPTSRPTPAMKHLGPFSRCPRIQPHSPASQNQHWYTPDPIASRSEIGLTHKQADTRPRTPSPAITHPRTCLQTPVDQH